MKGSAFIIADLGQLDKQEGAGRLRFFFYWSDLRWGYFPSRLKAWPEAAGQVAFPLKRMRASSVTT